MRRILWISFLVIDLLVIALFVGGYLARYISPYQIWWGDFIAVSLPYLSLLLLGITFGLIFTRRRLLQFVHLLIIAFILIRFIPTGGFLKSATASGVPLTLLTYNVPFYWGNYNQTEKGERLIDLLEEVEPDLVAFQEASIRYGPGKGAVRPEPYLDLVLDSLGLQAAQTGENRVIHSTQPVFGRLRIESMTSISIKIPGEPDDTEVVRVEFEWKGRRAVLYNLHLRSFGSEKLWHEQGTRLVHAESWRQYLRRYRRAFRIRSREAEQIRELILQETLPLILCGDFNSTQHNFAFHQLVSTSNLHDAFKENGRGWGATFHSRLPFARIDFVLVSPEWEVVSARVIDVRLSDHLPLKVDLDWKM